MPLSDSNKIALAGLAVSALGVLIWIPFLARNQALIAAPPVRNLYGV